MEKNKTRFPIRKTKRLDTVMKKAKELSILCNIDVAVVGTHQNPTQDSGSSSSPATWHTWPEDQSELARILDKFEKKMEENEPEGSSQGPNLEFDLDKALETMSTEELIWVYDRAYELERGVDQKLDFLMNKQSSATGIDTPPTITDSPMDQATKDANSDELDSRGVSKGFKLFGVFIEPDVEVQTNSGSQSSQSAEIRSLGH